MAKRRHKKTIAGDAKRTKEDASTATTALMPVDTLSDDMATEVLLRLPLKAVARFRCVSPAWGDLISSNVFKQLYYDAAAAAAANTVPRFALVPADPKANEERSDTPSWNSIVYGKDSPSDASAGKPCLGVFLLGRPCDGLFFLCNPSTGGLLRLSPRRPAGYIHSASLGYHAATGEHKVLLLEHAEGRSVPNLQGHVLTVGARQRSWRAPRGKRSSVVRDVVLPTATDPAVFANGRLHFMLSPKYWLRDEPQGILSFSLGGESFDRIPPPPFAAADAVKCSKQHVKPDAQDSQEVKAPAGTTLAELDGSLCMVRDRRTDAVDKLEVWKLQEYAGSGSWSLDYVIDLVGDLKLPRVVVPLCYIMDGETRKILLAATVRKAHLYDPKTKNLHTVATDAGGAPNMRPVFYHDSLVSMAGMEYGTCRNGKNMIMLPKNNGL